MGFNAEHKSAFLNQGYFVKKGIYRPEDLQPMKDAIARIIEREAQRLNGEGELHDICGDQPFEKRLSEIHRRNREAGTKIYHCILGKAGGGFSGQEMLNFIRHQPLIDCIQDLIGPDIIGSSVYRIRPKLPHMGHGEVPWHQDSGYLLSHCDRFLIVTCWIPLVDVTVTNGCLYVLPGCHRDGILRHCTGGPSDYLVIPDDALPDLKPIPVEMTAGDVLFLTNMTPHASFTNSTDSIRWSLDVRYQAMDIPNNVDEQPADITPDRPTITIACLPTEADFVIRDTKYPEREIRSAEQFHDIRQQFETTRPYFPDRGWPPV